MKILSERQSDVITGKWPEEHKPTTESPYLETIVDDDLEDVTNDEVHMFLLRPSLQDKASKVTASNNGIVIKHTDLK